MIYHLLTVMITADALGLVFAEAKQETLEKRPCCMEPRSQDARRYQVVYLFYEQSCENNVS